MNYVAGQKYDGMIYFGERSYKNVNGGKPLPLFELPTETAESWNAKCRAQFLRYYVQEHGHEPKDFEAEYAEFIRQAYVACGRQDLTEAVI